ncbi:hypothetical protein DM02DRAFT_615669 [Periconia macrospinosa]|uniref:Uncharacterized protein n=1 Tax=Periconia macrospinosa TaxID=97972 RepID=A0A2V1DNC1_9PLEO|nr:hypothetical protein DM02DRAFT_615669 [Periconia macrospinosa]
MNGTRLLTDVHLQELLAASQTSRMDRLVKLAVSLNNRLLALGPHVRSCQATTVVLGMQLQHTLMRPRPLLRLRMLAKTFHHESLTVKPGKPELACRGWCREIRRDHRSSKTLRPQFIANPSLGPDKFRPALQLCHAVDATCPISRMPHRRQCRFRIAVP